MAKPGNSVIAFVGLLALVGGIAAVTPAATQGQAGENPKNVNVVNTPSVNVANTPVVRAQQGGPWTVGIAGTPGVQVVNGLESPVLGRDVDEPARQPFQRTALITFPAGQGTATHEFDVPATSRLVIEYVSARLDTADSILHWFSVRTSAGSSTGTHFFGPIPTSGLPGRYTVSQQTRVYAHPGSTVTIEARRLFNFATGESSGNVAISGYLVDM